MNTKREYLLLVAAVVALLVVSLASPLRLVVIGCLLAAGAAMVVAYRVRDEDGQREEHYADLAARFALKARRADAELAEHLDAEHYDAAVARAVAADRMAGMAEHYQRRPRMTQALVVALLLVTLAVTAAVVDGLDTGGEGGTSPGAATPTATPAATSPSASSPASAAG